MDTETKIKDPAEYFHHIHHEWETGCVHVVHHCGGEHAKIDRTVNYNIRHCSHQKHAIDKKMATGHDLEVNEMAFEFQERCSEGGWHVESGKLISCAVCSRPATSVCGFCEKRYYCGSDCFKKDTEHSFNCQDRP
jgi:hypothetical protein